MVENDFKFIDKCPITGDDKKITYLELGQIPLVNNLCNSKKESLNCKKYELTVNYFPKSDLSSLNIAINPEILYSNYFYKSGISQPYIKHCENIYFSCNKKLKLSNDYILDIGGNDGTLLKTFLKLNPHLKVLNVDMSSNLTKECIENNIPAINKKWGFETAKSLDTKFKLITTTNCFQHTKDINDFVKGIKYSLKENGIWCLEFPYWKNSLLTNQFDQVYHEHVYYYLVSPLKILFEKHNLQIIDITNHSIHGGSLRILISHQNQFLISQSIDSFINKEKEILDKKYYKKWADNITQHIDTSRDLLIKLKQQNKTIVGFGAAAKGCVYLNSANIDYNILDCVIDDTNLKQNKYIPGTGIPIVSREYLKNNKVDYILILAHNFTEYIVKSLYHDFSGKFIVFSPKIKIF
jgi:ubiquinone/menaquinone biosynthesis C-methylase UbiE